MMGGAVGGVRLFWVGPGEIYDIAEEEPAKDRFSFLKPTFLALKSPF